MEAWALFDAKDDEVTPSPYVSFIWGKVSHNDVSNPPQMDHKLEQPKSKFMKW